MLDVKIKNATRARMEPLRARLHLLAHVPTNSKTDRLLWLPRIRISYTREECHNNSVPMRHLETEFAVATVVLAHDVEPDFVASTLVIYTHLYIGYICEQIWFVSKSIEQYANALVCESMHEHKVLMDNNIWPTSNRRD